MQLDAARIAQPLDIAVVGLGYVGLPLAIALARHHRVIGFDIQNERIDSLKSGIDATGETTPEELASAHMLLSSDPADLHRACIFVIAVPTPVDADKLPDLGPLRSACRLVGRVLKAGDLVIFESTVYPGATEEECVPVLTEVSGLVYNRDYFVGYSPERINPGDRQRRLADIIKVTSGSTESTADFVDALYRQIVPAGTHKAPSIRVAEAAKAVENTQRDINIAFANELAKIFSRLGIDTEAVLAAAATKWNFMNVRPGLVGGHCIGVDPYYLIHKAESAGADAKLIRAAREVNESMSSHAATQLLSMMVQQGIVPNESRILILGLTFKENCSDIRNTRVVEIIRLLERAGAGVDVFDPWCNEHIVRVELGVSLCQSPEPGAYDAIMLAVAHDLFRELDVDVVHRWRKRRSVVFDLKGILKQVIDRVRL